jgi:hypothetical protein
VSSWIKCVCGNFLHKNLAAAAGILFLVSEDILRDGLGGSFCARPACCPLLPSVPSEQCGARDATASSLEGKIGAIDFSPKSRSRRVMVTGGVRGGSCSDQAGTDAAC